MNDPGIPEGWSASKAAELEDARLPESLVQPAPQGSGNKPVVPKPKRRGWLKSWVFWAALGGLVPTGVGLIAVALILRLPSLPNCPTIFWPTASASIRIYCAQVAANKHTVNDLLQAIALVEALPPNHPLRLEINHSLQQWSFELLALGDQEFQAGNLEEAIAIAHKIPRNLPAYQSVENRIESWQSTWSEAEGIYRSAETEIHQQHWHQAFSFAVRLLNVSNNYWANTKYDELNDRIETARTDTKELAKAQTLAQAGGSDNLLAAIKQAELIGANSDFYQDAQAAISEFGRKLLDLAQEALDRHDADNTIKIASSIPASTKLQSEAQDLITLAGAWRSAWTGTMTGLQDAIASAKNIGSDRPLYNKAQGLIAQWQLETGDVAHLERASELAQGGTVKDFRAAITEVQLIPDQNPRASDRDREITDWRDKIETIEDQPTIDRAEQFASLGDINSLQAAIDQASQIASGRALYKQAQSKISNWTSKIEQIEDQPYLDHARSLASSGDLSAAIAQARQIQPGRALSSEAQAAIDDWQGQIQARENWRLARELATQGTPEALREAILKANRVPTTNPLRTDVDNAVNQWSHQMLSIAQDRGEYDIPGGIAIAKQIPPGSDAYKAARNQIELWQNFLNPESNQSDTQPANAQSF